MKATGLVRRIDNLGRIIIPKEVRKELKIREGDQIEIFTYREGHIILKKYSPLRGVNNIAINYFKSLKQAIGKIILMCDRDYIILVSGTEEKYLDKKVSIDLGKIMEDKKLLFLGEGGRKVIPLFKDEVINGKYSAQIISPILAEGYVIGTIIIISREQNKNFSEMELKSAEIASLFLGNQIEG